MAEARGDARSEDGLAGVRVRAQSREDLPRQLQRERPLREDLRGRQETAMSQHRIDAIHRVTIPDLPPTVLDSFCFSTILGAALLL